MSCASLLQLYPVVEDGLTDSGCLDNVMEFLVRAGMRSLPEAAMMMVPEAWEKDDVCLSTSLLGLTTVSRGRTVYII